MNLFRSRRKAHLRLGRRSESIVASYLARNGYEIWARNWKTGAGELDIVAWNGSELHFVEVKSLHKKERFSPMFNLSPRQRRRNFHAARVYLAIMGHPHVPARFDLFELEFSRYGKLLTFRCTPDYLPEVFPAEREKVSAGEEETEELPQNWLERLWWQLNLLPCPVCGTGQGRGWGYICRSCLKKLKMSDVSGHCPGCGGVNDSILELCSNCISSGLVPLWKDNVSLFEHRDLGRELVLQLKFRRRFELARQFGILGADSVRKAGWKIDVVTAVPMAWYKRLFRPCNQSELFGRAVARYLGVPYKNTLKRTHFSPAQKSLGRAERLKNLKGAFRCKKPEYITGRQVLLIDDVFTTGATMTAAVRSMLKAGPEAVYLLTISRAKPLFKKRRQH